jgi:O-antigen/teichoic acid export membrane protein
VIATSVGDRLEKKRVMPTVMQHGKHLTPVSREGVGQNPRRIALNALVMYVRMAIVMVVNLYTVRLVLGALGVEDFGIYDVLAGLVSVAAIGSNMLATSTQRFYSVAMGHGDEGRMRMVFSASLVLLLIFSLMVLLVGIAAGTWVIKNFLMIPPDRLGAANQVFHLSLLAFVLGIIHIPFSSAVLCHEDIGIYAGVSTVESIAKLSAAYLIASQPLDRLVFHGVTLLLISLSVATSFIVIASMKYPACRFKPDVKVGFYREFFSFSGWTFFGSLAGVGLNQAITLLINVYFGPAASAARAISVQIGNVISTFTVSLISAVKPALIRAHAEADYVYLNAVFSLTNKFTCYGLLMVCLPLIVEMEFVLVRWLGVHDQQTVLFCRLMVVYAFVMALNNPISIIMQATGRIREYNLIVEFFTLMAAPAAYLLFKAGFDAYYAYWAMFVSAVLAHAARLWCLQKYYPRFDVVEHLRSFIGRGVCILTILASAALLANARFEGGVARVAVFVVLSAGLTPLLGYFFGFTASERALIRSFFPQKSGGRIRRA